MSNAAQVSVKTPTPPSLDHLFDVEFQVKPDLEPVVTSDDRDGELIGTGEGRVDGEHIKGKIQVSMYAANCALLHVRAGVEPGPGQHICKTNPGGVIETDDGARIEFDARGYGYRGPDPSQPHLWRITMGVQFGTDDPRYRWLNTTLGVWHGEFNEQTGQARHRVFSAMMGSFM